MIDCLTYTPNMVHSDFHFTPQIQINISRERTSHPDLPAITVVEAYLLAKTYEFFLHDLVKRKDHCNRRLSLRRGYDV